MLPSHIAWKFKKALTLVCPNCGFHSRSPNTGEGPGIALTELTSEPAASAATRRNRTGTNGFYADPKCMWHEVHQLPHETYP